MAEAMTGTGGAILFGIFVWWFSTGAILWAATRPGRWPAAATYVTFPVAVAAVLGLIRAGGETDPWGAFEAFSCAILLWGWFELAFLSGVVLGPVRTPCPPGLAGWARFRAAWRALAHHELALAAALLLLTALAWNADNRIGLYTFAVLFFARISAKLNVFLGVPNITEEFLPSAVAHLKSFFNRGPANALHPVTVAALGFVTLFLAQRAFVAPAGSGAEVGFILISTLCALALVEHLTMVLKVGDAALWRWALPEDKRAALARAEASPEPRLSARARID